MIILRACPCSNVIFLFLSYALGCAVKVLITEVFLVPVNPDDGASM